MPLGLYRNKAIALGCILISSLVTNVFAQGECNCIWQGSFADIHNQTDLVVSGSVTAAKGNSIDLNIERILSGETFARDIRIWLKTKNYCRPSVAQFPLGTRWVMALYKISEDIPGRFNPNTPNVSYGRIDDFILSSCGGYWLKQQGNTVTGNLIDAPRWARDPEMIPLDIDILASFIEDKISRKDLVISSRENTTLKELMLETRAFLRSQYRHLLD